MPDHLHAILSFARDQIDERVYRDWKRFHARTNRVFWQEGYFDHRLRADERGAQLLAKMNYIRQNPVAGFMREKRKDWPWVHRYHSRAKVESASPEDDHDRTSTKAQILDGKAVFFCQRVEDNAFSTWASTHTPSRSGMRSRTNPGGGFGLGVGVWAYRCSWSWP